MSSRTTEDGDLPNRRVEFLLKVKKLVASKAWNEFGVKKAEGPLFYFHDDKTYIFFSDTVVKKNLSLMPSKKDYYKLQTRYDSIPFHMETQIEFDTVNSNPLLLNHPIEFCSSPEETQRVIPSVRSTEMWATMAIHEMFHHFQFNNAKFRNYMKTISELGYDNRDLKKLIDTDSIFDKKVKIENTLLLEILACNNNDTIMRLVKDFIHYRIERRSGYSKSYPYLIQVENAFEKMEGSARYLEYQSILHMHNLSKSVDYFTVKNDSLFNDFAEFNDFELSNDNFEYLQVVSYDYYYTLGFNLIRVLDKLNINYQNVLFNIPNKSLTDILIEAQGKNSN